MAWSILKKLLHSKIIDKEKKYFAFLSERNSYFCKNLFL